MDKKYITCSELELAIDEARRDREEREAMKVLRDKLNKELAR